VKAEVEPESQAQEDQAVQSVEDHAREEGPLLAFASKLPETCEKSRGDKGHDESGDAAGRPADLTDAVGDLSDAQTDDEMQLGN
jgi:hypothetical protein